jgi:hypothetical protein
MKTATELHIVPNQHMVGLICGSSWKRNCCRPVPIRVRSVQQWRCVRHQRQSAIRWNVYQAADADRLACVLCRAPRQLRKPQGDGFRHPDRHRPVLPGWCDHDGISRPRVTVHDIPVCRCHAVVDIHEWRDPVIQRANARGWHKWYVSLHLPCHNSVNKSVQQVPPARNSL